MLKRSYDGLSTDDLKYWIKLLTIANGIAIFINVALHLILWSFI